jgi:hypothetical protein
MFSEVSTIDTCWFIAGALYAAEASQNAEIKALTDRIFQRIDFNDMRTDGGTLPEKLTLSMGWMPETGYLTWGWDSYAEHLLLVVLGLGKSENPLPPESWAAWRRQLTPLPNGQTIIGGDLPLFVHQYSHVFVDLRTFEDSYGNYFDNSVLATAYNKSLGDSTWSLSTSQTFWGLSASDGPWGYWPYSPNSRDGTVCPGCAAASVIFSPDDILSDIQTWAEGPDQPFIWGTYGFVDGMNVGKNWYGHDALGITVGAAYLALADLEDQHSIWQVFSRIAVIQKGLEIARRSTVPITAQPAMHR